MAIGKEKYFENDELKIYRGEDFVISKHIKIHQPTLDEIERYGEQEYYSMIYQLTATPQTMKSQLWDIGIDYTEITPYQLFYQLLFQIYPKEKTSIIFGDLDFQKFQLVQRKDNNEIVLFQEIKVSEHMQIDDDRTFIRKIIDKIFHKAFVSEKIEKHTEQVYFDEYTYNIIMDYLRSVHGIEKDERIPANESTKMILIEDAKDEIERNKNKEYHSQLKNLISSMVNSEGFKYNHSQVWDMKINAFMDSVKRISKIKNAELLLQSGYSGYGINLKDVDKKQLDWLGELE